MKMKESVNKERIPIEKERQNTRQRSLKQGDMKEGEKRKEKR